MCELLKANAKRERATRIPKPGSSVLREIRAALARMDEDQFGQCLNYEEEISPKRLRALPWTPLCPACKEQEDQSQSDSVLADWASRRAA